MKHTPRCKNLLRGAKLTPWCKTYTELQKLTSRCKNLLWCAKLSQRCKHTPRSKNLLWGEKLTARCKTYIKVQKLTLRCKLSAHYQVSLGIQCTLISQIHSWGRNSLLDRNTCWGHCIHLRSGKVYRLLERKRSSMLFIFLYLIHAHQKSDKIVEIYVSVR